MVVPPWLTASSEFKLDIGNCGVRRETACEESQTASIVVKCFRETTQTDAQIVFSRLEIWMLIVMSRGSGQAGSVRFCQDRDEKRFLGMQRNLTDVQWQTEQKGWERGQEISIALQRADRKWIGARQLVWQQDDDVSDHCVGESWYRQTPSDCRVRWRWRLSERSSSNQRRLRIRRSPKCFAVQTIVSDWTGVHLDRATVQSPQWILPSKRPLSSYITA